MMYSSVTTHGTNPRTAITEILSYVSRDGFNFTQIPGVRVGSLITVNGITVSNRGHPLVYQFENGTWIMYYDTYGIVSPQNQQNIQTPTMIAVSQNGVNWTTVGLTSNLPDSEAYGIISALNNTPIMIFGFYGIPGFQLPYYTTSYGSGLYYAMPSSNESVVVPPINQYPVANQYNLSTAIYAVVIVMIMAVIVYVYLRFVKK